MDTNTGEKPGSVGGRPRWFPGWRRVLHNHFVAPIVSSRNPPWFDARGAAMGLIVGFGCPVGLQVVSLVFFRMVFRFNSVIAFAFSWVTNPFTFIPMYYGYYYLGSLILHRPSIMSQKAFKDLLAPMLRTDYFWESVHAFGSLGWDVVLRWFVTAILVSAITAPTAYVATYHFQRLRCRRRARKLGISYEKLVADLETRLSKEKVSWEDS